jgi:putative membrane-bound dehydrogenase-like protein
MRASRTCCLLLFLAAVLPCRAADANRLTYLDGNDPYYVSRTFARLVTPQWIGEEGVEAVVILAIDDMREPERYEAFLRPILRRLQRIDGRAPVSIMTNQVDPKHPLLQRWLKEGLSLETHTIDHPCPLLAKGDLAKAHSTYERCVDLLARVPGSRPVAFRIPCCDSLNTVSPRFFAEIFNQTTPAGNFLTLDSSVFNVPTSNDPALPRHLVQDPDGRDRFLKYLPYDRSFVNTVEDYPYPYVIGRLCWEFPCVVPSDWEADHYHKAANPLTVRDWKAALDATVLKQGVFTMVFHPYAWIKNEQLAELVDYAAEMYGKKVKFLTFREAQDRLDRHLLGGQALRGAKGQDNGVRLIDVNNDGYLDVVIGNEHVRQTRIWSPATKTWTVGDFPVRLTHAGARFGILRPDGLASLIVRHEETSGAWHFDGKGWVEDRNLLAGLEADGEPIYTSRAGKDQGVRLRDLDRDGCCELIVGNDHQRAVFSWSAQRRAWQRLPFSLPAGTSIVDGQGRDAGLRFVDLDEDGLDDVLFSNEKRSALYRFRSMATGWDQEIPTSSRLPIVSRGGTDNGAWFHSRHLWVQNEDTALLKDHVDRRSFNELLGTVEPTARGPEASRRSITTRPGFAVELVAAEPLVQDPIAFAWGPDGKFWVVEMADYPLGLDGKGKPGGRVKYLEDTDGDGVYDKATLFLDGLSYPTSVLPWGKGVIVSSAPEIFYAEDTDGDGKADVHRPLFVGFNEGNPQHRVNSFVWGLDNWIYGANGDSGGQIRSTRTGETVNLRGHDFRIRPDEGRIELETGQTQFGRTRDDWGNWFGCNNSDPMYQFVLPDHYLRRNPNFAPPDPKVQVSVTPGASPVYPQSRTLPRFNDLWAANHFTSACSVIVYRDELFGPHFANNSFVSEPVHNLVHREIMSPQGVSFTSRRAPDEQHSEFLASSDNWCRPTTIQTGPDGALWIADMYRQVIEHPEWIPKDWQKRLDLRAGADKGRIYRVYPVWQRPRPIPRLDQLDTAGLAAALDSPNGWQRDTAQQLLIRRHDPAVVPLLEKQAVESERPLCRLHALCTLDGLAALQPAILVRALKDSHPGVRRHAVRLCETRFGKAPELGSALLGLVVDPDVQVRMQLAFTLGEWRDPRAGEALGRLALADAEGRFVTAAVLSSVRSENLDRLLLAVLSGRHRETPPARMTETLLQMASRLGDQRTLTSLLEKVIQPEDGKYARWQFAALGGLLDTLDQRNSSLDQAVQKTAGDRAALTRQLATLFDAARTTVADAQRPMEDRLAAVRVLGRGLDRRREDREVLAGLLTPQNEDAMQAAAVAGLGRLRDPAVPELLLRGWKACGPGLRSQVLEVLLRRDEWVGAVLDAVERKQVLPFEIDAARRQRLLLHRTEAMRERASRLLAGAANPDRLKVIDAYRSVFTLHGDAERGSVVFTKTCASCHQLRGIGHAVGPDLASLGDKSPESITIAVLDPNRAVEARYQSYTALTHNGLTLTGVLANETGGSITIIEPEGKRHVILRSDLEELTSSNKSVMPEGLEKDLKPTDLADLVAFIRSAGPVPQRRTFAGNKPEVVRPSGDGALRLRATNCEIYGSTLVLEQPYKNLGYWTSADDQAVWTVELAHPGRFGVWLQWACAPAAAGNSFVLDMDGQRLAGKVAATANWDDYREVKVGELSLPAGRHRVILRPGGKITGAMIDLQKITLFPVAGS